jgi:uncharacterized protein (DUF433 family)
VTAARKTGYRHIALDAAGVPHIAGTTMKLVELVLDHIAYGWSAEELHLQHPHLSLGQILSALAYYWDHKEAIDQDIARRQERVAELQRTTPLSPLVARLKREPTDVPHD